MNFKCKVTCPHCKETINLISIPQSLEEMKEQNVTGQCWNCHHVFLMADAVSEFSPLSTFLQ